MELVKKNTNKRIDGIVQKLLALTAILSALFILIIIVIVAVRGLRPFFSEYGDVGKINFFKFVTGTRYYAPEYRIGYVIINTLYIVFLSIIVSAPISILTA